MAMVPISIVIPVGPLPVHKRWLPEMMVSIGRQTVHPFEVLLINDGNQGEDFFLERRVLRESGYGGAFRVWTNPWKSGPAACMNFGVSLADKPLAIMACADDKLFPTCVERCWEAWEGYGHFELGYYYLGVEYSSGEQQNVACGAAMVTKELWEYTGGFPPHCAVGAADHIFLSALIAGSRDGYSSAQILKVSNEVLYWYRQHEDTETSKNVWGAIEVVRDWFTTNWRPNDTSDAPNNKLSVM